MEITIIIFILFFRSTLGSAKIEITDMNNNPGLIVLATGKSFLKVGDHKIYHIIDLETFEPTVRKLETIMEGLSSFSNFSQITKTLSTKFSNVKNLYFGMLPKIRNKRGLLNFVGTGIKQLTGNMDHEDFLEITKDLNELKLNNFQLVDENNKQIRINFQMQDRINSVIAQLKLQQDLITKNLIASRQDNGYSKEFKIIKEIFNINVNLDHLNYHLQAISESIHFAKLKIISKHILNTEELGFAIQTLENKGIIIENYEQVYDYLEVSAFFNHSKLIFVIGVPQLQNITYNNFILEALPVGHKILKIPAASAITSEQTTYFITRSCAYIGGNSICTYQNLLNYTMDTCYPMLLRGLPGNCTFEFHKEADIIKPITNNHVIVLSKHETHLNSTCGVLDRKITGKLLIEFHNCTIVLNGSSFARTEFVYSEKPFVLPLHGLKISETKLEISATIEDLQIENRHHLTVLTQTHKQHVIATYGISITGVVLGLLIVIYLLKISNFRVTMFNRRSKSILQINADPSTSSSSTHRDVASSGGGVVKTPLPLVPTFTSSPLPLVSSTPLSQLSAFASTPQPKVSTNASIPQPKLSTFASTPLS